MKKFLFIAIGLLVLSSLGCETVKGMAQDIQNTGDNIWEGINKKKN